MQQTNSGRLSPRLTTATSSYAVTDRIEEARLQDTQIKQMRAEFGIFDANNDRMITRDELH